MTKTITLAALVVGSMLAGSALQAQDTPAPKAPPAQGGPGGPGGMRGRPTLEQLTAQLALTEDQKPKFKVVFDEQQQKTADLRNDGANLAPEERRAKMKEIRDAATAKLKDILTPEQLAKWEKLGQRGPRPGAGGPPPANTPPPDAKN